MGAKSVEIIRQGSVIPGRKDNNGRPKKIPADFLSLITSRVGYEAPIQYKTCDKGGFLNVMPEYRPGDSYAMLAITM